MQASGAVTKVLLCLLFTFIFAASILYWDIASRPSPQGNCICLSAKSTFLPAQPRNFVLQVVDHYPQRLVEAVAVPDIENSSIFSVYYATLYNRIAASCGPTCDDSVTPESVALEKWPFAFVRRNVNCPGLFLESSFDAPAWRWPPPQLKSLPSYWQQAYTMQDRFPLLEGRFFTQRYSGGSALESVWTRELIQSMVEQALLKTLPGNYGNSETNCILSALDVLNRQEKVRGKRWAVVGSENPWAEACLLAAGAQHITTIEYGRITSLDERVATFRPSEFNQRAMHPDFEPFDGVLTFSSVEHSGLGRYGDELNPWGDIIAIQRMWCVTKPGGVLVIGVMMGDGIEGNAHRMYGPQRYPHLTANWEPLFAGCGKQQVFAFSRCDPSANGSKDSL